jgi:ADP-ribose pyrophosphatase
MRLNSKSEVVFQGKYLHFCRTPGGWEYVRRPNDVSGVSMVAVTDDAKLLLVEQRRPPLDKLVIELPAGLVDPAESEVSAVRRELEEETGYRCGSAVLMFKGTTSPGLTDEMNSMYLVSGLTRTDPAVRDRQLGDGVAQHDQVRGKSDEGERIVVYEVPMGILSQWLRQQQENDKIIDLRVYIGASMVAGPLAANK